MLGDETEADGRSVVDSVGCGCLRAVLGDEEGRDDTEEAGDVDV